LENTEGINVLLLIVLGTLGMLTLASFIIVFVVFYQKRSLEHINKLKDSENLYQKKLLEATVEVTEREREKIAANVHDDVGLSLNLLKLNGSKIKKHKDNAEKVEEFVDANSVLIEETYQLIRSIANDLVPSTLSKLGFLKEISILCRRISKSSNININLISDEKDLQLDKKKEIHLYRLCKEILNNIIKHANSNHIEVSVVRINNKLLIDILHNGQGIDNNQIKDLINQNKGIGLKSIFSRAQLTGSIVNYYVNSNESKVTIETPIT